MSKIKANLWNGLFKTQNETKMSGKTMSLSFSNSQGHGRGPKPWTREGDKEVHNKARYTKLRRQKRQHGTQERFDITRLLMLIPFVCRWWPFRGPDSREVESWLNFLLVYIQLPPKWTPCNTTLTSFLDQKLILRRASVNINLQFCSHDSKKY